MFVLLASVWEAPGIRDAGADPSLTHPCCQPPAGNLDRHHPSGSYQTGQVSLNKGGASLTAGPSFSGTFHRLVAGRLRVWRRPLKQAQGSRPAASPASVQPHTGLGCEIKGDPGVTPRDTASRPRVRPAAAFTPAHPALSALCDGHTLCQPGQVAVPSCLANASLGVAVKVYRRGSQLQSGDFK